MAKIDLLQQISNRQDKIEGETKKILRDEEEILKEILNEERSIKKEEDRIQFEQSKIENEEFSIEKEAKLIEAKEDEIKFLVKSKVVTRKYSDVLEWKSNIWNNCSYKTEKDLRHEVEYFCKKLNKSCNFTSCPLNIE